MDIAFEILIPIEAEVIGISFSQPFYEWDGVKYAQGPEEGDFQFFKLVRSDVPEHIIRLLPEDHQAINWKCFSVTEGLDKIFAEDKKGARVEELITDLLQSVIGDGKNWVVVFEPNNDQIDYTFEATLGIVSNKITRSLLHERIGFVMWSVS